MSAQPAPVSTPHDITLEPILSALRQVVPAPRLREATLFAQAFYARMSPEEYGLRGPDAWAALSRGWESPHTVIQIANDDMPFLVDTVSMALAANGHRRARAGPSGDPKLRRDPGGKLLARWARVSANR
jgi:glutamate dehydrogenase